MADGILALSPLSYWAFPETTGVNAANSTGGTRAVLANGAVFSATGVQGRGVTLDGVNDLVSVAHSAAYAANAGAMSLWFRPDALGRDQGLISKNSTGLDAGGGFTVLMKADGTIQFQLESSTATFTIQSTALASAGAWNNVTISWGAGGMQLWVNGTLAASNAYTGGLGTTSGGTGADDPLVFGANTQGAADGLITTPANATDLFKGSIDEAVMMSRQPTAAEINAIFLNGSIVGNANPVANADALGVLENAAGPFGGNVLTNDTDANGDTLSVFAVKGDTTLVGTAVAGTYGVLTLNANGTYSYALNSTATNVQALRDGQTVTDTFAYTASDGKGGLSSVNLVVTVTGQNDAPVVTSETRTTNEDGTASLTGNVLTNDRDLDGGSLSVASVNGAAGSVGVNVAGTYGSILISANGAYTYSMANASAAVQSLKAGQVVNDTFTYGVSDGQGGVSSTTITVSITGRNDAPVVVANAGAVTPVSAPTTTGNVLTNDSDVDGDALIVSAVKGQAANVGVNVAGTYGVLRLNADGTYTYTVNSTAANVIALAPGQTAFDTFAYTATDGTASASTNLVITVTGINEAPAPVNDARTIAEDPGTLTLTGNVLTNDRDPDAGILSVAAVNGAAGNVGATVAGTYGSLNVSSSGAYTYALANASAAVQSLKVGQSVTDTFTYTVSDGQGGTAVASVVVTVTGKNDAPTVVADTGGASADGTQVSGNALTNDSDIDGDAIVVSAVKGAAANVGVNVTGTYGVLHLNADGTYTYAANPALAATIALAPGQIALDTFAYTARDINNATTNSSISISVVGVNDAPRTVADARTIAEDPTTATLTGSVLTNDSDPDGGVLSVSAVNGVAGNVGGVVTGTYGTLTVAANGTYTYTLANASAAVQGLKVGQSATDTFTYTASDGQGGSTIGSFVVTVTGKNDAPTVIAAATGSVTEDITVTTTGSILSSLRDADIGDTLTVNQVKGVAGNVGISVAGTYGSLVLNANGTYTYTLNNALPAVQALNDGQTLTDTFAFRANDGSNVNVTNNLVITITGRDENHAPVAVADTVPATEDIAATFDVRANDTDSDGDALTVTHIAGQAVTAGQSVALSGGHSATLNAGGTITVTPAANYNGNVAFAYTISDGHGGTASSTATFSFAPVNDAPVATNDTASTNEDQPVTIDVLANDTDIDGQPLSVSAIAGQAVTSGQTVSLGGGASATLNANGTITYAPALNASGVSSFAYTASDSHGGTSTANVDVTVNAFVSPAAISFGSGVKLEGIERVSTNAAGAQSAGAGGTGVFSSDDTRVVFGAIAADLVPGDTNGVVDTFVKNLLTGAITRVSTDSSGAQANGTAAVLGNVPVFSPDGTKVAFGDAATNLVAGDTNGFPDFFLKDLITGVVTRISTDASGAQGNNTVAGTPIFSPDGTKLMFQSLASNLVPGDTNNAYDVFVKDLITGAITRISTDSTGGQSNGPAFLAGSSFPPRFSPDGTKVVMENAGTLVPGDTNGTFDIFMKDLATGLVTRVSTTSSGAQANSASFNPTFSPDGTKVLFWSAASNLVSGDTNGKLDVLIKDLTTGAVTLVSTDAAGVPGNGDSTGTYFSPDGTKVIFSSSSTNLVAGDTNAVSDIFVKDLVTGVVTRISTDALGAQGNGAASLAQWSYDGTKVSFTSGASNLVTGDTNAANDIFVARISTPFQGQENGIARLPITVASTGGGESVSQVVLSGLPAGSVLSGGASTDGGVTWTFNGAPPADLSMTAPSGFDGSFTLTITATTSQGAVTNTATATKTVTFTTSNHAPEASNFTGSVAEDGSTTFDIHASANDPDGNAISLSRIDGKNIYVGQPVTVSGGVVSLNADGTFNVAPTHDSNSPVTFTYTVTDGPTQATATAHVDVTPVNDPPVAVNDTASTDQHTPVTIDVVANDTDVDGDTLHVSKIGGQAVSAGQTVALAGGGSATLNVDGTITFSPSVSSSGPVAFSYTVADASGAEATASGVVTVTVAPVAAEPVIALGGLLGAIDPTDITPNTQPSGNETLGTVAVLANGDFVVAWSGHGAGAEGLGDVFLQRYSAAGVKIGSETLISTTHSFYDWIPSIAALPDGGYVAVWVSESGQFGSGRNSVGQRFDATGAPVGGEFRINQFQDGTQQMPTVATLHNGGFVVAWWSGNQDGGTPGIYQRIYDPAGAPAGSEMLVNTTSAGSQISPSLAVLSDGSYVIAWTSNDQDGSGWGTYAQRFSAAGAPLGGETQVNTATTDDQWYPAVAALADGGYIVTWSSANQDGHAWGVYAQRYDASGTTVGGEFQVNSNASGFSQQRLSSVVGLPSGGFVISWGSPGQDGSGFGEYAQVFDAAGQRIGQETRLNAVTSGDQFNDTSGGGYELAVTPDGVLIQVFKGNGDFHFRRFDSAIAYQGNEDHAIRMPVFVAPGEAGDTITAVVLSGLPAGSVLSAGASNGDGSVWTFTGAPPAGLMLTPPPNYNGDFEITITATAQDGASTSIATATQTIVVNSVNDVPVVSATIADQSAAEDAGFSFTVPAGSFTDADAGDTLTYTATLANGSPLPTWLSFNETTQTFSGTPADGDVGVLAVRVTATDGFGASASDVFDLSVVASVVAPAITFTEGFFASSIERISTTSSGGQLNGASSGTAVFSSDDTRVVFASSASDLVAGDTNGVTDVFVKNLVTGAVTRVSTDSSGAQGNATSGQAGTVPIFSLDGTKVAFISAATNLVAGDTNGVPDWFVKNLTTGVTTRVSTDSSGAQGVGGVGAQGVANFSPDGTKILFVSTQTNLVAGDTNNQSDLFMKDLVTGVVTRLSTSSTGVQANGPVFTPSVGGTPRFSEDGTKVAFESGASNLVTGDTNNWFDIFIKDVATGAVTRVSTGPNGEQANNFSLTPVFSPDGTKLLFWSAATNLVANDTNAKLDLFMKDLVTGQMTRISETSAGVQGDADSTYGYFSTDGKQVVFGSAASTFVVGDTNAVSDVFVKDLATGAMSRISNDAAGFAANGGSGLPQMSYNRSMISFQSTASNLVPGDTNGVFDMFLARVSTAFKGTEDGVVHLPIKIAANEPGEAITQVVIAGLPAGSSLNAGSSGDGGATWAINGPLPADLILTPPANYGGSFTLTVTATTTQGASTASSSATHTVDIAPVVASPSLAFGNDLIAGQTYNVSTDASGALATGSSYYTPAISADGRYVAFLSDAPNLVPGDTNARTDIFVKDTLTGAITRVSTDSTGAQGTGGTTPAGNPTSLYPAISPDGRYALFGTVYSNLSASDTNNTYDVFLKDLQTGVTTRLSAPASGASANGVAGEPTISADNRFVVFHDSAANLVTGDTNALQDVFMLDRQTATLSRISTTNSGAQATGGASTIGSISADGSYVAFQSTATNLVAGDTNGVQDIFVKEPLTGVIKRASEAADGTQANGLSDQLSNSISADGRYVAFRSSASNLVAGDTNGVDDVFVKDMQTGAIQRISVGASGVQGNGASAWAYISADGRYVTFDSAASNLVPGDVNAAEDVFVKDLQTGAILNVSTAPDGSNSSGFSFNGVLADNASRVTFWSTSPNLVPGDTNAQYDVFVRDLYKPFTGIAGGKVGLPLSITPNEPGEAITQVVISGLPAGSTLSAGVASAGGTVWTISGPPPADLTLTPPSNYFGSFTLSLAATSSQGAVSAIVTGAHAVSVTTAVAQALVTFGDDLIVGPMSVASTSSAGGGGNANSSSQSTSVAHTQSPAISSDGRYVGFLSDATNLVSGDTNATTDVFVKDTLTGALTRVSTDASGAQGSGPAPLTGQLPAWQIALSHDGQYAVFSSIYDNITPAPNNTFHDIFIKEVATGAITRITNAPDGAASFAGALLPVFSGNDRFVAYQSVSANLVSGDTNGVQDIFVYDRQSGTNTRVSTTSSGGQTVGGGNTNASISGDGRYVVFASGATNLVANDTNGQVDIFVKDTQTGAIVRVSEAADGTQANNFSTVTSYSISADGRYVVFSSSASNLVAGDQNGSDDVFVKDLQTGAVRWVSETAWGLHGNGASTFGAITPDGRYATFQSSASNLTLSDVNNSPDIFVKDLQTGAIVRASTNPNGSSANNSSAAPTLSDHAGRVVFYSGAGGLVATDTNGFQDVFVRDIYRPFVGVEDSKVGLPIKVAPGFGDSVTQVVVSGLPAGSVLSSGTSSAGGTVWTFSGPPPADLTLQAPTNYNGAFTLTVTATTTHGTATTTTAATHTITITAVDDAPVVGVAVPTQSVTDSGSLNYVVPVNAFVDVDGDALTLSATLSDGSALPAWLSFDPATRTFSGSPAFANVGALQVKLTATDGRSAASQVFELDVTHNAVAAAAQIAIGLTPGMTPIDAGDIRINTTTDGAQTSSAVAALADGGFLSVWLSDSATGSGPGLYLQRFAANGAPVGGEHLVTAGGSLTNPAVAGLPGGGFVIAWSDSGSGIYAQRYDASSNPAGGVAHVNTFHWTENETSITALDGGGYVVAWSAYAGDGAGWGVLAQRYDASGGPVGGEVVVDTSVAFNQRNASVAALSGGGYVVTWTSTATYDSTGVYGQRYDASGATVGGEFKVSHADMAEFSYSSVVSLKGGGFVVAYSGFTGSGGYEVYAQRYDASGVAAGAEALINTTTFNTQFWPSVAALDDGGYVVTWTSGLQDGSGYGMVGQRFDAQGVAIGGEISLNATTVGHQLNPNDGSDVALATLNDGSLVQTFFGDGDAYVRRFHEASTVTFHGQEDGPGIAMPIAVTASDAGDTLVSVVLSGLPAGSVLSSGVSSNGGTTWTFAGPPPANLTMTAPANYHGAFTLNIDATTQDGASIAHATASQSVTVAPVAVAPVISARAGASASGEIGPIQAGDVRVNTTQPGGLEAAGVIAKLASGFAVVFADHEPGFHHNMFVQLYTDAGVAIGSPTPVTEEVGPQVPYGEEDGGLGATGLANGGAVAVWTRSGYGVLVQRFDAGGSRMGGLIHVNATAEADVRYPQVAAAADGGFAVTWWSTDQHIYLQRYAADGAPQGVQVTVNTSLSTETAPKIQVLADGGYVVAWFPTTANGGDIVSQRFDASGAPLGGETIVNTTVSGNQYHEGIAALTDGGYVIGWSSVDQDGSGYGAYAQRFDSLGAPVGAEFRLNTTTGGNQAQPMLIGLADGGFFASWTSGDGSSRGIFGQRYDAAGQTVGGEVRLNATTEGDQWLDTNAGGADLLMLPGGVLTQVFLGGGDIYFRQFDTKPAFQGMAGGSINLPINIAVGEVGETISHVTLSGLPAGSVLSAGTSNADGSVWAFTGAPPANLTLTAPTGYAGEFTLTITATEVDGAATALATATHTVSVAAVLPPLILDINGDGVHLISGVAFDFDGDGALEHGGWASAQDAFLALDRNGDGQISGISEISFVGDAPGATSDLEGLRAFDTNGDGVLSAADAAFGDFRIWQDADSDAVAGAGEVHTLADAGIASIGLARSGESSSSPAGNILGYADVTLASGETIKAADVVLGYTEDGVDYFAFDGVEHVLERETLVTDDLAPQPMSGFQLETLASEHDLAPQPMPGLLLEQENFDFSGAVLLQGIHDLTLDGSSALGVDALRIA